MQTFHRRCAVLPGFGIFSQTPEKAVLSLKCPHALLWKSFESSLKLIHSAFSGEHELQVDRIEDCEILSLMCKMSSTTEATGTLGERGVL